MSVCIPFDAMLVDSYLSRSNCDEAAFGQSLQFRTDNRVKAFYFFLSVNQLNHLIIMIKKFA